MLFGMSELSAMMQQQKQMQTQEQDFAPIKKKKGSDNKESAATQPTLTDPADDIQMQMAALLNSINETYGSVEGMIDCKLEDHERICPTCGALSIQCSVDQDRLSNGHIMRCGCGFCRGRGNRL